MLIAVEDVLSEAVARCLIGLVRPDLRIDQVIGKTGISYLKGRANEFNRAAAGIPILLLVDLDNDSCPAALKDSWFKSPVQSGLLFRVAIVEIEAWLLADRSRLAPFLGALATRIPQDSESILNPKELVVSLARSSRNRKIRDDLVPAEGSTAKVGPAYNARLVEFVNTVWQPLSASASSDSLSRAIVRLRQAWR